MMEVNSTYAPIVLFVYKRLEHTKQTIEALAQNELASESTLYIFSDAPKNKAAVEDVNKVREYISSVTGFKSVNVVLRRENYGLARNIIDGVGSIVNEYGRIIVLEDDILTSPFFLRYMNSALDFYQNEKKVMEVIAYTPPIDKKKLPDFFLTPWTDCWGWGTWKEAWNLYERDPEKLVAEASKEDIYLINRRNSVKDRWNQVLANKRGELFTWAIFWCATVCRNRGYVLTSKELYAKNIGMDGTGEHFVGESYWDNRELSNSNVFAFPKEIKSDREAEKAFVRYYRKENGLNYYIKRSFVLLKSGGVKLLVKKAVTILSR